MTIRVAVIGARIMGADHARIIASELHGADLRWICDADEARARSVADATGARHVSKDPLATIEADDVDAVLIASPDHTHADLVPNPRAHARNGGNGPLCAGPRPELDALKLSSELVVS